MLSYFRINDPYRLIIIFVVLFLFRLPYFISPDWLTIPELSWMIVGERMNEGALLYVGIWDDIGPSSAWVYRVLDFLFGRSQLALQILGLLLFFFQVYYVNHISLKHKMYNENNYLPGLFYGLLGLTFFNVITLSPQLIGLTFVLLSINSLFNHIETRNRTDGNLLNIGLYIGIASLFFLPYFIMILVHIVGLIFFTNTIGRRYLLLIYGVGIPLIICWLVYVWHGNTHELYSNYFHSLFSIETEHFLTYKSILILSATTILLFTLSALKTLAGFGFTIFQVRTQKVMFFAAGVALLIYMFYSDKNGYSSIMFFPWAAIFLSHFFLSIKNGLKRELSFFIYFLSIVVLYVGITFQFFNINQIINLDPLIINATSGNKAYADKKILVLGPDIKPYLIGKQATPYFNWSLSKGQLEHLDYYDNLEAIDKNIRSDMPDFIVDQIDLAPKLFEQIPLLGTEYEQKGRGIYKRIRID
ncbi:MAG: hypothetical protein KAI29_17130 [Cyclobacteriaceae bacterium]|nr:hypothetical protein [Cyclobacteriaceae bacterium]